MKNWFAVYKTKSEPQLFSGAWGASGSYVQWERVAAVPTREDAAQMCRMLMLEPATKAVTIGLEAAPE